jgi:cytochrome c biogenesis protein CcdA
MKAALFVSVLALILAGSLINAERMLKEANTSLPCPKCPRQSNSNIYATSYPLFFIYGVASGFSPCLIALISFVVAATLHSWGSPKRALKKVVVITGGVFYLHIIILYLIVPVVAAPTVVGYATSLATPLAVILVILGGAHLIEVIHDFYTGNWRKGGDPIVPLFKTPKSIKGFIQKMSLQSGLYFDFSVGILFSFIKLCCTLPLLFSLPLLQPIQSIASVTIFNVGLVFPMLLFGVLLSIGFLKASQLREVRSKGRILQRTIIGTALIVSSFLVLR